MCADGSTLLRANIAGGAAKRSRLFQKKKGGADTAGTLLGAAIKAAEDGCAVCKKRRRDDGAVFGCGFLSVG